MPEPITTAPMPKRHALLWVSVKGDRLFAARIHSQDDPRTATDWRDMSAEIRYEAPVTRILRGGDNLGALTLTRFYAIHMLMLPALMLIFMGIHLYLVVRLGITPLPQKLDEAYDRVKSEGN